MKIWNNRIKSYFISFIIFALYSFIFFRSVYVSIVISAVISIKFQSIFFEYFKAQSLKQEQRIFRDLLDLLNSSIMSGQNFYQALSFSGEELEEYYDPQSYVVLAVKGLKSDLDNGKTEKDSLKAFKIMCRIKEAGIFADTLIIALGSGMDLAKIISSSRDSINSQMDVEFEVSTSLNSGKRELIIMILLPLLILFLLTKTQISKLSFVDYLIRSVVFIMILFSIHFGEKIINLEISNAD